MELLAPLTSSHLVLKLHKPCSLYFDRFITSWSCGRWGSEFGCDDCTAVACYCLGDGCLHQKKNKYKGWNFRWASSWTCSIGITMSSAICCNPLTDDVVSVSTIYCFHGFNRFKSFETAEIRLNLIVLYVHVYYSSVGTCTEVYSFACWSFEA